jgi:hypothetical protein
VALPQLQANRAGGQSIETVFTQMQNAWAQILNKIIARPQNNSTILADVALINGTTTVQHNIGQPLTGWQIVRINGAATIYDQQSTNTTPSATLILVSNAAVTVTLEVF